MAGKIHRLREWLEQAQSPFLVSRLILMTGVRLRDYGPATDDDDTAVRKLRDGLRALVTAAELQHAERILDEK